MNRSTVYRAYEELRAAGYLESRPGSYTTVRGRGAASPPAGPTRPRTFDWRRPSTPAARRAHADFLRLGPPAAPAGEPGVINFARLTADRDLYPVADLVGMLFVGGIFEVKLCQFFLQLFESQSIFPSGQLPGISPGFPPSG